MKFRYLLFAAAFVVIAWTATPFVVARFVSTDGQTAGQFGDMFGATNALFSGLALIGVVAAILLQQQELKQSTTELRNSARALTKQVELAADTARMQSLPILINLQKTRVQTYGGPYFKGFTEMEFTDDGLKQRLEEQLAVLNSGPEEIRKLGEELEGNLKTTNLYGDYDYNRRGPALRELGEWQQKLYAAKGVLPELVALRQYMQDLHELYHKMKDTKLEIVDDKKV